MNHARLLRKMKVCNKRKSRKRIGIAAYEEEQEKMQIGLLKR